MNEREPQADGHVLSPAGEARPTRPEWAASGLPHLETLPGPACCQKPDFGLALYADSPAGLSAHLAVEAQRMGRRGFFGQFRKGGATP